MPGFGKLDWDQWLYGLFYAMISGGATAVTSAISTSIVDPQQFNLAHPAKMFEVMGISFLSSGCLAGFGFLRQNPLPHEITVSTTATVTVERAIRADGPEKPSSI